MSTPGAPELPVDPESFDQTLEFYWEPPLTDGGSPVTNYRIKLCNADTGTILASNMRYFSSGPTLVNGLTYEASIQACNVNGFGQAAYFRPYQPGSPPNPPSTISTFVVSASNVLVTWTPPSVLPNATIFWYALYARYTGTTDNLIEVTADGLTQTNYLLSNLNPLSNYTIELAAVNCPDWSDPIFASFKIDPPLSIDYFAPTNLLNLQAWYDGADPIGTGTAPTNGSTITTWVDKSPYRRNTSGGTAGIYSTISGGAIVFNGTNTAYPIPSTANVVVNNYFTIFVVERLQNSGKRFLMAGRNGNTDNTNLMTMYYPTNMYMSYYGNDLIATNTPAFTTAAAQPIRIWSFTQISSIRAIYMNGSNLVSDTNNSLLTSWANATLGYSPLAPGEAYQGNMHDILFYNNQLPTYSRQQVEGYLAWKWGLQSNLPSNHPYRSTQPLNPGLISPYSAPNLSFWLDATRISTISSGTALTSWTDSTSNAYVGTASNFAGCNKPIYQSSFLNGYMPAVTFSSNAGNYFNYGNILDIRTSSISIFAVLQNSNTEAGLIGKNRSGGINYRWSLNNSLTGNGYGMWFYAQGTGFFNAGVAGNAMPATPIMLNANWNRNTISLFSNGGSISSNAAVDTTSDFINSGLYTFVGANQDSTGQNPASGTYMNGGVGEILVFMSTPIQSTRQKIEGYLSWKWGLTQNLPNQHPYKFYPPLSNYSSIAINTTQVFATNFNNGNDAGFVNFSNTRLISSPGTTITGTGAAYNTGSFVTNNDYPMATYNSFTTNNVTWCASLYLTTSTTFKVPLWNRNHNTGVLIGSTANRIAYSWNEDPNSYDFNVGAGGVLPFYEWTHVAITISANEARFYINGSNIATRSGTNIHPALAFTSTTIGKNYNDGNSAWPGYIDNVRFYSTTLTSNEIQAIYYNTQFV